MPLTLSQDPVAGTISRLAREGGEPIESVSLYESACRRMDAHLLAASNLLATVYALARHAHSGVSDGKIGAPEGLAMIDKGLELASLIPADYWVRDNTAPIDGLDSREQMRRSVDNLQRAFRSSVDSICQHIPANEIRTAESAVDMRLRVDQTIDGIITAIPEQKNLLGWLRLPESAMKLLARTGLIE